MNVEVAKGIGNAQSPSENPDQGMTLHIVVTVKQVPDPDVPPSSFRIDASGLRVVPALGVAQVINGYDEQAVEAALRIKEAVGDVDITVLSAGASFSMDVMKKPLAMGADQMVLVQDGLLDSSIDSTLTVQALVAAIRRLGKVDLILAGRQASDWDNAQVPLGIAEALGIVAITVARRVEVADATVRVERVLLDGYEVVEASLPAVVTVSNELGQARYPTFRGIMAAGKHTPTTWSLADLGLDSLEGGPSLKLVALAAPQQTSECEMVTGEGDADAGRKLALRLREVGLV
jgi:electron transfer flavoprotein beta subunit